ncbi:MAG TPA: hypothetical protein VFU54_12445 [Actinomycetota bacterium]|nr:hypothetical protein [Actinomycetota bacterium]
MTERYGYRYRDEPSGGERPSGRGAVAERGAGQDEEVHEIDLTDEATDREEAAARAADAEDELAAVDDAAVDDAAAADAEAGEEPPRSDRETSGAFEPHPGATAPTAAATSIFDVGRDETATPGTPEPAAAEPATAEPASPATPAATVAPLASLDAAGMRSRFVDIQAGFVDEPRQAVEEAGRFVDELMQQVIDALQAERGQLETPVAEGSTEDLRLALRAHRQFVDRLLGLAL